jgi:hypothetical protein
VDSTVLLTGRSTNQALEGGLMLEGVGYLLKAETGILTLARDPVPAVPTTERPRLDIAAHRAAIRVVLPHEIT